MYNFSTVFQYEKLYVFPNIFPSEIYEKNFSSFLSGSTENIIHLSTCISTENTSHISNHFSDQKTLPLS